MPSKKPIKKTTKKTVRKATKVVKDRKHFHFLAVLVLFSGFSLFTISSFFGSTNNYIDNLYASVATDVNDTVAIDDVDAPPECYTCPPFPICEPVCGDQEGPYEIFTDVMSDHPNAEAIETLYFDGIINGYSDGSFKPENNINRAELMTIITTATDADFGGESYGNCFSDVQDQWFAVYVCYAKAMGWVSGYSDGSYKPAQNVIKAESLKIVLEAFDFWIPETVTEIPYPDVSLDDWFVAYAYVGKENGVTNTAGNFDAAHVMTRAEFVQMIYNAMY